MNKRNESIFTTLPKNWEEIKKEEINFTTKKRKNDESIFTSIPQENNVTSNQSKESLIEDLGYHFENFSQKEQSKEYNKNEFNQENNLNFNANINPQNNQKQPKIVNYNQSNYRYNNGKRKSTKKNLSKESTLTKTKEFFKKGVCIFLIASTLVIAGKSVKKVATHVQTETVKTQIKNEFNQELIINQINSWTAEEVYQNLFKIYLNTNNDYDIMDMAIKKATNDNYKHFHTFLINEGYLERDYDAKIRADYKAWENAMEARELEKRIMEKEVEKTKQSKGAR